MRQPNTHQTRRGGNALTAFKEACQMLVSPSWDSECVVVSVFSSRSFQFLCSSHFFRESLEQVGHGFSLTHRFKNSEGRGIRHVSAQRLGFGEEKGGGGWDEGHSDWSIEGLDSQHFCWNLILAFLSFPSPFFSFLIFPSPFYSFLLFPSPFFSFLGWWKPDDTVCVITCVW